MLIWITNAEDVTDDVERLSRLLATKRERLIEETAGLATSAMLAKLLEEYAETEGAVWVLGGVKNLQAAGHTVDEVRDFLISVLCSGADDTWSGRTNDVRRAAYDGKRAAAQTLLERI